MPFLFQFQSFAPSQEKARGLILDSFARKPSAGSRKHGDLANGKDELEQI